MKKYKLLSKALIFIFFITNIFFFPASAVPAYSVNASVGNTIYYLQGTSKVIDNEIDIIGFSEGITDARVSVENFATGDTLIFTNTPEITGAFDSSTGILTLTGSASAEDYQEALRTVKFSTTSEDTTDRVINFVIGSGLYNPDNGHFYEFVASPGITWSDAVTAASGRNLYGKEGYLATITSASENAFVTDKVQGLGWIGGKDITWGGVRTGDWRWVTGPEGLADGGSGTQFYTGYATGENNTVTYDNWWSGEPNNGDSIEYVVHIFGPVNTMPGWAVYHPTPAQPGQWNDWPGSENSAAGYVVEYGEMAGDLSSTLISSKTIDIQEPEVIGVAIDNSGFNSNNTGGDSDESLLWIKGNSYVSGGDLFLTNTHSQVGSVVRRNQINLNDGFSTYFQMYFSGAADGIVFIAYKADEPKLGNFGGALGYGWDGTGEDNRIRDSIAVEFDTWNNNGATDNQDILPDNTGMHDHTAIMLDGNIYHNSQSQEALYRNSGLIGNTINAWVDYNASTGVISVTFGGFTDKDNAGNKTISRTIQEGDNVPEASDNIFVGFTSATGGNSTTHKLLKWYFKDSYVAAGLKSDSDAYIQGVSTIEIAGSVLNPPSLVVTAFDETGSEINNQNLTLYLDDVSQGSINTGTEGFSFDSASLARGDYTLRAVAPGGATNFKQFQVRNTSKAITVFNLNGLTPAVTGTIDEAAKTVTLIVDQGTDVTALVPTITITGETVSPLSGVAQDFTSPVTYTVTADDGSTQDYVVTVQTDSRTITGYYIDDDGTDTPLVVSATVPFATGEAAAKASLSTSGFSKLSDNSYIPVSIDWEFNDAYNGNISGIKQITGVVTGTFPGGIVPTSRTGTVTVESAPPSGGDDSGDSGGGTAPQAPAQANPYVEVLVNGKSENAGTINNSEENGRTTTVLKVDEDKINQKLEEEGNNSTVTIPVNTGADKIIGQLNGQMVKNMENKEAVLEVNTGNISYILPAQQINIDRISQQLGQNIQLQDIQVQIEISKSDNTMVQVVENVTQRNSYSIVIPPVDFKITCTWNNQTVDVTNFNNFVERTVAVPEGVDPSRITTGIVVEPDGTVRHVPTQIIMIEGKYYAKINSLTNSTYSVIYNEVKFSDVQNHWAAADINEMGSRLVISGVGNNKFEPERNITRAEFASIIVRALGLKPESKINPFNDVAKDAWYNDSVGTAYEYKLISGYGEGKFGPQDNITREQAMAMISNAMKLTGLKATNNNSNSLELFEDGSQTSEWAEKAVVTCIDTNIVSGKGEGILAPKDNITRGEVAVIVKRLLEKSNLI